MKEMLIIGSENTVLIIKAMALVIVAIGTVLAFLGALHNLILSPAKKFKFSELYLRYARFLIAGLTIQLGADIIETAISPSWDQIGKMAAIAIIRTFLNYFLERDMFEAIDLKNAEKNNIASRLADEK